MSDTGMGDIGFGPRNVVLHSRCLELCPQPDFCDAILVQLPEGTTESDPARWAEVIFTEGGSPAVAALMAVRNLLVPIIGAKPGSSADFRITETTESEAIFALSDRHLDFWAGLAVDLDRRLLQITTAVHYHGWRGKLYFVPVGVLHAPVVRAMVHRAIERVSNSTAP